MTFALQFDGAQAARSPLSRFSFAKAATAWADKAQPLVRDALKDRAPVGKGPNAGRLKKAIRSSRQTQVGAGLVRVTFKAHVPYIDYVLDGTRPHLISAKAARSLHWKDATGRDMFRRTVHHPGTKANPFNERAVFPLTAELRELFRVAIEASMEGP